MRWGENRISAYIHISVEPDDLGILIGCNGLKVVRDGGVSRYLFRRRSDDLVRTSVLQLRQGARNWDF